MPKQVKEREGELLHHLWKRRAKRSQAAFAADCGFTQGYLPQFFKGIRPLTTDLAQKFADELQVVVGDFSPRLADEIDVRKKLGEWPFKALSRERYMRLSDSQKFVLETYLINRVEDLERATYDARSEGKDAEDRAALQRGRGA